MSDTQTPEDTQTVAMQPQPATDSSSQQVTSKISNTKPAKNPKTVAVSKAKTSSRKTEKHTLAEACVPGGGTPLYGLCRYVRPQRVGFFSRFSHK